MYMACTRDHEEAVLYAAFVECACKSYGSVRRDNFILVPNNQEGRDLVPGSPHLSKRAYFHHLFRIRALKLVTVSGETTQE